MPPVFHSGQYTTYCQNNLLCMGSDLLLLLLMFFFVLYCGYTIDKAVSTLASVCWTIFSKYRSRFLEVFSQKDVLKILILVLKNNSEGTLVWRSCTEEPTKTEHLTSIFRSFFTWNISSINHLQFRFK